jgi:alpha-galactosidase/6-phospho-beta-glucosidase family protein
MEKLCPDAVMINLSNPLSTITRAVAKESSIKVAGICTSVDSMAEEFARILGIQKDRLRIYSIGVNHFTWLTDMVIDGKSRMDMLEHKIIEKFETLPVTYELYKSYGIFPIPGYKYASEFYPYYLSASTNYGKDIGFEAYSEQAAREKADRAYSKILNELNGREELTFIQGNLDTDTIVRLMESSYFNIPGIYTINSENRGRLPNVPYGATVEGPVYVCGDSVMPLCVQILPDKVNRLLERIICEQEVIVRAAAEGDRSLVMEAFLMDPLVTSMENARRIIDELMLLEKDYLPQFN